VAAAVVAVGLLAKLVAEEVEMPKEYEVIRDRIAKGAAVDSPAYNKAQSIAAAIYNKRHPGHPLSNRREPSIAQRVSAHLKQRR
jgi:hypothetical protein